MTGKSTALFVSFLKYLLLVIIVFHCDSCNRAISSATVYRTADDAALLAFQEHLKQVKENEVPGIDAWFKRMHRRADFSGSVLMAERGHIIYEKSFGLANRRENDTLTLDHAFQLASVSKPITALAVLMLKDQGRLHLDDTLQQYFPNFPYEGITVRMLLSHRSGLPNYMYFAEKYWPNRHNPITNEDVLCMLEQFEPNRYYIPDYRYNYCNTNYAMLALLVKRVSGRPFHEFVETEVFKPLNMQTARVYDNVRQPEIINPTTGYERRRAVRDSYLNGVSGDKNIYASVHDLLKLDQALYNNTLIKRSTLEEALLPHHKDLYLHDNYGLGWRLNIRPDCSKVVYHTGWWKGYRTFFVRLPDEEKTAIVLSNTNRGRFISTRKLVEFLQYNPA